MIIDIDHRFRFHAEHPTDILLQFEAADIPEQRMLARETRMPDAMHCARICAQDDIGERIWVHVQGEVEIAHTARVEIDRLAPEIASLKRLAMHDLPGETVKYLFDSRYCAADRFQSFVQAEFGECSGGERAMAIHDWIAANFSYEMGSSSATTTALDSFVERRGICRDYAHVMVTLARASGIPARFVSCFAPGVTPQDFHAVAEVFLEDTSKPGGGAWYLVDPTGMAEASDIVKIGVGRDAADVSFMTSFGDVEFRDKEVRVAAVQD